MKCHADVAQPCGGNDPLAPGVSSPLQRGPVFQIRINHALSLVQMASSLICNKREMKPRNGRSLHSHPPGNKITSSIRPRREMPTPRAGILQTPPPKVSRPPPEVCELGVRVQDSWVVIRGRFINCRHGGGPLGPAFMHEWARNHAAGLQGGVSGSKS